MKNNLKSHEYFEITLSYCSSHPKVGNFSLRKWAIAGHNYYKKIHFCIFILQASSEENSEGKIKFVHN